MWKTEDDYHLKKEFVKPKIMNPLQNSCFLCGLCIMVKMVVLELKGSTSCWGMKPLHVSNWRQIGTAVI